MKKNIIKKAIFAFAILFIGLILYLNYQTYFSENALKGKVNIANVKKVKRRMSVSDVLSIMGKPNFIDYCDGLDSISKGYNYDTNDESYVNVTVCFDSIMKVKEVYYQRNH